MDPQLLNSLLQYSTQIAQQQYQWGQNQFNLTQPLTDQVVNDFLTNAGTLQGLAANNIGRYENTFQPQENALIADANSYAGAPRVAAEMGRAGATAAQAGEQARQNSLADLRSYGIDPSSGRYASLDTAERAQEAASVAGAENQARLATEATGRGLRSEAIQVGERYPGQIVSELSGAASGLAGAENAALAHINTGVNAMGNPVQWENSAVNAGNATSNAAYRAKTTPSGFSITEPKTIQNQDGGMGGGAGGGGAGAQSPYQLMGGSYPGGGSGGSTVQAAVPTSGGGGGGSSDPFQGTDYQGGFDMSGGSFGYNGPGTTDQSAGSDFPVSGGDAGSFGYGGDASYGDTQGIAAGGPAQPTTGGAIDGDMSPSQGAIEDDVPARLNAYEYVIPRDVALWQGQKHFQSLIDKSRQEIAQATAKPQMKPALNAAPAFRSQAIPTQ